MVRILGYGEDVLTFWALTNRLSDILRNFLDKGTEGDCTILYRPSFGRGGRTKANFGEFDAIIAADHHLFLIESKWASSSECRKGKVKVRETQQKRHKIFQWYFENWEGNNDWTAFKEKMNKRFSEKFPGKEIAPTTSILAANLRSVLEQAVKKDATKKNLVHVLLLIYPPGAEPPASVEPDWFKLVKVEYTGETGSQYFDMI